MSSHRSAILGGAVQAIAAALLFGLAAPLAKHWLTGVPPLLASGLLYLASGLTLGTWLLVGRAGIRRPAAESPLRRADLPFLAGAIVVGGVLASGLLLYGLSMSTGTVASLLLNLETVFTVLFAVVVGESIGWRAAAGIAAILAGSAVLAVDPAHAGSASWLGAAAIAGAGACWGLDNILTQRISGKDPVAIAAAKSLVAGPVSLVLAVVAGVATAGGRVPGSAGGGPVSGGLAAGSDVVLQLAADVGRVWPAALVLGAFGYGLSIVLFVRALRVLGAARTGSLFATAPFAGALAAIGLLGEAPTWRVLAAGTVMALGVLLISRDRHDHEHAHDPLEHEHRHRHDDHHQHEHLGADDSESHSHSHRHDRLVHSHPHLPDIHHRHQHE